MLNYATAVHLSSISRSKKINRIVIASAIIALLFITLLIGYNQASAAPALSATVDEKVTSGTNHFSYSGNSWTDCGSCNPGAYKNSFKYAYTTGDKVSFTFTGTQAKIYGFKEAAGGIASVSVDGAAPTDVNYYSANRVLTNTFSTPVLPQGVHTVKLTVSGRTAGGASPTINVDKAEVYVGGVDTTNPTVTLTAPTAGSSVTIGDSVALTANASDDTGVTKVAFYINGTLHSTDTSAPYTGAWSTVGATPGTYTISAKAYDAAGNTSTSANRAITLTAPTGVPVLSATVDEKVTSGTNHFSYSGNSWTDCGSCNPGAYKNSFKYAYTTGDKVTFTFGGTQAKIYSYKELAGGIASVSVDGATPVDVDFYSANQAVTNVFTTPVLTQGTHTISLTVTGRKALGLSPTINIDKAEVYTGGIELPPVDTTNPTVALTAPTTGTAVTSGDVVNMKATAADNVGVEKVEFYVDGALVNTDTTSPYTATWSTTGVTTGAHTLKAKSYDAAGNSAESSTVTVTVEAPQTNPVLSATVDEKVTSGTNHFSYSGNSWTDCGSCNPGAYKNSFKYAYTTGDKVSFTFTGTQAKIYGFKEAAGGIASVSVDGAAPTDVNYYSANRVLTNTFSTPVLPQGVHTVKLTVSGRTAGGASPTINVDKAEVYTGGTGGTGENDTISPTVALTAPANNASITVGTSTKISTDASDNVGVTKVEFFASGSLVGSDTSSPYSINWNTNGIASGSTRTITAKAYDAAGNTTVSNGRTVTFHAATAIGTWWSGQSDTATTKDGSFAAWRGRPVEIAGNWASTASSSEAIGSAWYEVGAGDPQHSSYANIPRVDYAIGAMIDNSGESWSQAAAGAYDARWTQQLQQLKLAWGTRDASNMFIRFAHEFNGNWYPWKVAPSDVTNFKNAWIRFAHLRDQYFPGAQLVWCPNAGSSYNYDIRTLYPGNQYVDVVSIDKYNNYPWVNDQASFNTEINRTANGGPLGLETYRQFALAQGKPFAVSEWSNDGLSQGEYGQGGGDSPNYVQYFDNWLKANGSQTPQAGKILYEILFNVTGYSDSDYSFFPLNAEPGNTAAANKYAELW